jgi:hypothetical protein
VMRPVTAFAAGAVNAATAIAAKAALSVRALLPPPTCRT